MMHRTNASWRKKTTTKSGNLLAHFEYNLLQKIGEFLHDCHRLTRCQANTVHWRRCIVSSFAEACWSCITFLCRIQWTSCKKRKNHRKRSINNFRWIFCWSIRNSEETMYKKDEKKNQIKRQKKTTSHSDTKWGTISKMQIVSLPIPCHYITFSIESRACNFTAPFICVCFEHQWTWMPWYCECLRPCHHHTIHS